MGCHDVSGVFQGDSGNFRGASGGLKDVSERLRGFQRNSWKFQKVKVVSGSICGYQEVSETFEDGLRSTSGCLRDVPESL